MIAIPAQFARKTIGLYAEAGVAWLDRLPAIVADCARRWSLTVGPPFPRLSYNYVAPAVQADGTPVILKVGFPSQELLTEIAALQVYAGRGSVRLLAVAREQGALLLEQLTPGTTLAQLAEHDDEAATTIAAEVMRQLWRPPPVAHAFPTVAAWAAGLNELRREFDGGAGPFPIALVEEAETLFTELLGSLAEPVLLHGDLHHENILRAARRPWLALDRKGIVGEPAYEVGALLRNPIPQIFTWPRLDRILARRVDQLAEALDFDRARLRGWGLAQAVLAAWWSYEEEGQLGQEWLVCAEHLAAMKE